MTFDRNSELVSLLYSFNLACLQAMQGIVINESRITIAKDKIVRTPSNIQYP